MAEPTTIYMTRPPSLNALWAQVGNKRIRTKKYRDWITTAGWEVRAQYVGKLPIESKFDMVIYVPISNRDTGNWEKGISDLLQSVGVITNDGNMRKLAVEPVEREDCMVVIKPVAGDAEVHMNQVVTIPSKGALAIGGNGLFKDGQAKLNAIIDYATKVREWPLVEEAIDAKLDDQAEFVKWWKEKVRGAGNQSIVAGRDTIDASDAEVQTGITKQQVSRWLKALKDRTKYREKMISAARRKAGLEPEDNHRAEGTGENEWYTPEKYIEAAREVMGDIELDPATSVTAQHTVRADRFYTQRDDGLNKPWSGKVWLNPPYAQPLIGQFVDRLTSEFAAGRVTDAILLTHNYTDTTWFHLGASGSSAICFTRGRIGFLDPDGEKAAPTQGQAFFYYGKDIDIFADVFGQFGLIVTRHA